MPRTIIVVAALGLLAGSVSAQPGPVPPPTNGGSDIDLTLKQKPNLTSPEMVAQGQDYLQKMNGGLKRILKLQDEAKRQKDIIKLNCVTDKLVQTKVNINIAEQAMSAMQEQITRSDDEARNHEFARLTIVNQKVQVLVAEAENCIGEDMAFVGATRVDTEIDPSIPTDDPTQPPPARSDLERPPEASPFR